MNPYAEINKLLRDTRTLLADEKNWTKGEDARDKDGNEASIHGKKAVCWCLGGAIYKVAGMNVTLADKPIDNQAIHVIRSLVNSDSVADWNDKEERTHAEIMHILNKAIEATDAIEARE